MIFYMYALRRFGRQIWREPHTVMGASLLMLLLSLPVVTAGLALCAGVQYMHDKERGIGVTWRGAVQSVRPCMGKAGRDFALTLLSTVFLYLALFYLSTALYRYPILVLNPSLPLTQVALCATGIALKNLGYVFLYWCVLLLALMICAVTGVGLVLLLPGASALLMATAWSESLKRDEYKRTNAA